MATDREVTYVRVGAFSGSALSLRDALKARVKVNDVNLLPLSRSAALLPSRIQAFLEAWRDPEPVPWLKTAAWSSALQTKLTTTITRPGSPVVFVQTLPAFVMSPDIRYVIYTDRVGREGAAVGGRFASRSSRAWRTRETMFLQGASRVYVMGPSTRDVLIHDYRLPAERVEVVGAGPNASLGGPRRSEQCRRLLFVGTDWHLKGGPELLAAFDAVRADVAGIELTLVGSTPAGVLPAGVRVVGRVPAARMDEFYSWADALVIPTHMEAFGIALVEGLIKGLPCVGTTVGNQPWIIGSAGICVAPGDIGALVHALRQVIQNYPHYHRQAEQRGAAFRRAFTWQAVADAILQGLFADDGGDPTAPPSSASEIKQPMVIV